MSSGPGKWQRVILAALEVSPAWYVNTLLPASFTRAEYVAILRAARLLVPSGQIEIDYYMCCGGVLGRVVVRRPGTQVSRDNVATLSVDNVQKPDLTNIYREPAA